MCPGGALRRGRVDPEQFCVADLIGDAPVEEDRSPRAGYTFEVRNGPGQHQIAEQAWIAVVHARPSRCSLPGEHLTRRLIHTGESKGDELAEDRCFAAPGRAGDHKQGIRGTLSVGQTGPAASSPALPATPRRVSVIARLAVKRTALQMLNCL